MRNGDVVTFWNGTVANQTLEITGRSGNDTLFLSVPTGTSVSAQGPLSYTISRSRVSSGDALSIATGTNASRSYKVAAAGMDEFPDPTLAPFVMILFRPPGTPLEDDGLVLPFNGTSPTGNLTYGIAQQTSPLDNVFYYQETGNELVGGTDPAVIRVTGLIVNNNSSSVPDGCTTVTVSGVPFLADGSSNLITVQTDYMLFRDARFLSVQSSVVNPGTDELGIAGIADIVITGGPDVANTPPWTPLAGFQAQGLDTAVIVPFASFKGRDEPQVSYTVFDSQTGNIIQAADGKVVAVNIQLRAELTLPDSETVTWLRHIAVGGRNDIASSADVAMLQLAETPARSNPANGTTIPNMIEETQVIAGTVIGAPEGTTVTAIQVSPALVFDPGPRTRSPRCRATTRRRSTARRRCRSPRLGPTPAARSACWSRVASRAVPTTRPSRPPTTFSSRPGSRTGPTT